MPDDTMAFGDISPSPPAADRSVSEAQTGLHDETQALGDEAAVEEGVERALGITRERASRADKGDVDTTPLSKRGPRGSGT
jgi:hypothetical protein